MNRPHNWVRPEDLTRERAGKKERSARKLVVQSVNLNQRSYEICNMNEISYKSYFIYGVNKLLLLREVSDFIERRFIYARLFLFYVHTIKHQGSKGVDSPIIHVLQGRCVFNLQTTSIQVG